jgi:hypothetical protein
MTSSSDDVSFVKASSTLLSSFVSGCSRGNPRSGAPGSKNGSARCCYPYRGLHFGAHVDWRWCYSGGNPRSRSPRSENGDARHRSPCWGHHFWSSHWIVVVLRGSSVSPPTSTMVGFGGVVSWKLDRGCVLCCVRREEEPFGAWWRRWQAW